MDNRELAQALLNAVGADNVTDAVNCMTRLRMTVRTVTVTKEQLQKLPGVKGVLFPAAGQIHIVLGPGKAAAVTTAFNELRKAQGGTAAAPDTASVAQLAKTAAVGDGKALHEAIRERNRQSVWKAALQHIGHIFIPLIPAFIGCGLLSGILSLVLRFSPSLADAAVMQYLRLAGGTIYVVLNTFTGLYAAKEFGGTPALGGVLAALLTAPGLEHIHLFGEALLPGRGGVFAALLIGFAAAVVERFLRRRVPEALDLFLTPLLTVFVVALGALFVFQPLGGWISDVLRTFAIGALERGGAATGFILGGVFLPVVMAGVHHGITPINLDLLATTGTTLLLPICAMAGAGQVGASFAVYVKSKNKQLKKTVLSSLPVGMLGIGEPLIYGVTLPLGRPFLAACFGGACGGAWQAYAGTGAYAIGISGLPLAASVTSAGAYLTGVVLAYVTGFAAAYVLGFDDPPAEEAS
jgi:PTS system sucrose-specific IIC component